MINSLIDSELDPTSLFDLIRVNYQSECLAAAVAHFNVFEKLKSDPQVFSSLRHELGLEVRPARVFLTMLCAMKLCHRNSDDTYCLTKLSEKYLLADRDSNISDYMRLSASNPGVLHLVEGLRKNKPPGSDDDSGAAFIFKEGISSAMDMEESASFFTHALAGRAKLVAPALAKVLDFSKVSTLLDVGGGTGIYSIACLRENDHLQATILDHAEVLKCAKGFSISHNMTERLVLQEGDMFTSNFPKVDMILLSNILHDWDVKECQEIVNKCKQNLNEGGQLVIHDVFLDDDLQGPLEIAQYSTALFSITEGRAYSGLEYREFLINAGLQPQEIKKTAIHCGVMIGTHL